MISHISVYRWLLETSPNEQSIDAKIDECSTDKLPLNVMNNYFSIGADAQAALQFHESRSSAIISHVIVFLMYTFTAANPEIFNSRIKNRIFYAGIGTQDLFKRSWRDLHDFITLEVT